MRMSGTFLIVTLAALSALASVPTPAATSPGVPIPEPLSPAEQRAAARERMKKELDAILHRSPLQRARVGFVVSSLDTGEQIHAQGADELLNPASNVKLITAATSFARLGPEFRFVTDFLCSGSMARGECKTLYIRGRGDPTLYTERIYGIAGELEHRGLRRVDDIVVDDSYFDDKRQGPGWEQEPQGGDRPYMAPMGALSVNHNTVAIYVAPGDSEKAKARIEVEPMSDYFIIDNRVKTASRHGRQRLVPRSYDEGSHQRIVVAGRLPLNRDTAVFYRKVDNPPIYAGETFKAIFKARGIAVRGRVKLGTVPPEAVKIYASRSEGLANIVREMDKVSSNFIAEQLIKTIGAESKGPPGTWDKGVEAAEDFLASVGIPRGSYVMKNGSGLNDTNRFSAAQLVKLLTAVATKTNFYPEFAASLGIAGRDGTVRSRMEGTAAEGRLRAKTGTLESVTALSGYVRLPTNETLVYSIIANDVARHHTPYLAAIDALGAQIAAGGLEEEQLACAPLVAAGESGSGLAEMKARIATYSNLAKMADSSNLPFLHSALRTERDPVMRAIIADAIFKSDKESGAAVLLDAMPSDPTTFAQLRTVAQQMAVPTPTVSSLIDIAADGNPDALDKVIVVAHQSKDDAAVGAILADGLQEIGRTAPDELFEAIKRSPGDIATEAIALLGEGISASDEKSTHPFLEHLKAITDARSATPALSLSDKLRGYLAPPPRQPIVAQPDVQPASAIPDAPGGG